MKPSDLTLHCSSLISQLVHKYLDPDCYKVVLGSVDQATQLLELKWASSNYLFSHSTAALLTHWPLVLYTGGINVGRIISIAAAKHMTPVVLEVSDPQIGCQFI
jgi:acyl-CoA reductase-like NAD-dependent aldehyde dehydrogenase